MIGSETDTDLIQSSLPNDEGVMLQSKEDRVRIGIKKRLIQATRQVTSVTTKKSLNYITGLKISIPDKNLTSRLKRLRRVLMTCLTFRQKFLLVFIICIHIASLYIYLPFIFITNVEVTSSIEHQHYNYKSSHRQEDHENKTINPSFKDTASFIKQFITVNAPNSEESLRLNKLEATDIIYGRNWWEIPTVIEEYKLIFFTIPKVACTEWKLLFRRMMGAPPVVSSLPLRYIQKPEFNNLTTLANFSLRDAEIMLNSPEWTKAVFVREPKERILSAFINKFVNDKFYFRNKCCRLNLMNDINETKRCNRMIEQKSFEYFLNRTKDCKDFHWDLQAEALDEKWWPSINFVGYMHSIANDTRHLLQSLVSVKDGVSAWEKVGKSGWGENGTSGFMQSNTAGHGNGARSKLKKYYTAEYEKFVEEHWKKDWNMDQYHFAQYHLFHDH